LRQLGVLLKDNIRQRDTLARLGGDEFAALLEHCSITRAQKIVNKILNIINEFRFVWENKTFRIGVSIGLVPITKNSGGLDDLLKQADAACYVAKNE
ncbi:MAG: diguanylate cyclase, partial [Candidatus Dadabacteria bacterium]|nr:diguanylate cyclase [Candidatus Dadabacteria bacterium]